MYTDETFTISRSGSSRRRLTAAGDSAITTALAADLTTVQGLYEQLRGGGTAANLISLWAQLGSLLLQGQTDLAASGAVGGLADASATACSLLQNIVTTVFNKVNPDSADALASTLQPASKSAAVAAPYDPTALQCISSVYTSVCTVLQTFSSNYMRVMASSNQVRQH